MPKLIIPTPSKQLLTHWAHGDILAAANAHIYQENPPSPGGGAPKAPRILRTSLDLQWVRYADLAESDVISFRPAVVGRRCKARVCTV